jgi:hypothetical protein
MDSRKVTIGAGLMIVGAVVMFATGYLSSSLTMVALGVAPLLLAVAALLIGTSEGGQPV